MVQKPRILLSLTRFLVSEGDKNLKYMRWVKWSHKKRSFYGQADRKGVEGEVSPLGPDRKQM